MHKDNCPVIVGKLVSAHALKGELKFHSYGEPGWLLGKSVALASETDVGLKTAVNHTIKSMSPHSGLFRITLDGIDTKEDAESLVGLCIYVDKGDFPELEEGEYYHADLIGIKVQTTGGDELGILTEIIETGANDVYQVEGGEKGEVLIPVTAEIIKEVDLKARLMKVELPEGLLDEE